MHRPMRETRSGMALLQVAFTDVLRLEETALEQQSTPAPAPERARGKCELPVIKRPIGKTANAKALWK
jgi:hypothetical protein